MCVFVLGYYNVVALLCFFFSFATFPLVFWVRCGTWLYRFLIFAPLLTLQSSCCGKLSWLLHTNCLLVCLVGVCFLCIFRMLPWESLWHFLVISTGSWYAILVEDRLVRNIITHQFLIMTQLLHFSVILCSFSMGLFQLHTIKMELKLTYV